MQEKESWQKRKNIMMELMEDNTCVQEVKANLSKFVHLLDDFKSLHESYQELLSEEEANQDEAEWFKPQMADFNTFLSLVFQWLSGVSKSDEPQEIEVAPKDSIFQVSICESRARSFSVASASLKVEVERAAILAQVAALKEKHKLEDREDGLNREKQTLKKKLEVLELEALLEASSAKLAVLMSAGKQQGTAATFKACLPSDGQDDLNAYLAEMSKSYTSECEFLSLDKVFKALSVAHTPSGHIRNGVQPNPVLQQSNEQNVVNKKHECVQATSTLSVQWGKKVFSQPPIVQVLPLKKMREACHFHHRYNSNMRDKIRKTNPENHIVGFLKNLFANYGGK